MLRQQLLCLYAWFQVSGFGCQDYIVLLTETADINIGVL